MTDIREAARAGMMRHVAGIALLTTGLVLAGCSDNRAGPAGSTLRTYAADLAGGARVCEVPKVAPVAGGRADAAIQVANDGGWCGIPVHQDGPKPFGAGLLMTRAAHGAVTIHEVGDDTRIDYTPDRGFAGKDAFVVKLIPGNAMVHVAVTVTPPVAPKG
jgi:hypothetical protein